MSRGREVLLVGKSPEPPGHEDGDRQRQTNVPTSSVSVVVAVMRGQSVVVVVSVRGLGRLQEPFNG